MKGKDSYVIFRLSTEMKKNHLSQVLEELSMVEFTTLHVLKRGHLMNPEQEITVSDLAKYTDSSLPAVSRILKQLEEAGLIAREIGEKDRRAISVVLTQKGQQILTREESRLKSFSEVVYSNMKEEDILALSRLMEEFQTATETAWAESI